ncbi:hypothetical protein ACFORL_02550 [Legionella dresdenensis]|uniref:Uncharacterized protein n=1 Tax=Legionella dresdenensis TaxID=450200 RepID=A0ABV8CCL9_9GAMM
MPVAVLKFTTQPEKNLIESTKTGAIVYHLPKITEQVFFPRCEFFARFGSIYEMANPHSYDTYHRSNKKKLAGVKQKDMVFAGNNPQTLKGIYPKSGNFYNPFHFKTYRQAVTPINIERDSWNDSCWYDYLLGYQKRWAKDIVDKILMAGIEQIKINADNNYPCVLLSFPKPTAEKNPSVWTQFYSIYFIVIANKLAYERGVNIEIHRRSSFDALRPSVAECGESLRISLGLIPAAYADCLVDAIILLHSLLNQQQHFAIKFGSKKLENTLQQYNTLKSNEAKKCSIALKKTLWETLWAPGDSSNRSFATQIFRSPYTVEYLINQITILSLQKPIAEIIANQTDFSATFVKPLQNLFEHFTLSGKSLSLAVPQESLRTFSWKHQNSLDDPDYWKIVKRFATMLGGDDAVIEQIITNKVQTHLHCVFEYWIKEFFFHPFSFPDEQIDDGYGSDSDEETEFSLSSSKAITISAKKLITATGMRAIQLCYAAAKCYLADMHQIDTLNIIYHTQFMYYETNEAISRFSIPLEIDNDPPKNKKQQDITFFDLNFCNNSQFEQKSLLSQIKKSAYIAIIDTTSSTTKEMRSALKQLFSKRPKLEIICLISSGLKNEQGMSDYNPYGTIRIFAQSKINKDKFYKFIVELEKNAGYQHPAYSHLLRKNAKQHGLTPTNSSILGIAPA